MCTLPYSPKHFKHDSGIDQLETGETALFTVPAQAEEQTDLAADAQEVALEVEATAAEKSTGGDGGTSSVGRSALLISALVIVSRITGFFRTWGQAFAMGTTLVASCYTVANNLPNLLYELVVGGMLVTAFLPVYMSVKRNLGTKGASDYTSNLVSIVTLLMGACTVLGFIFAGQLVYTQAFSASSEFDFDLTVWFFRFFVIEVVLYALSSIFSGVLNAERDYFWSSAAPIFNNIVITASFFAYAALLNVDQHLALIVLALGNPLGVLIQVVMQIPSLSKHGIHLRLHIDWHDPALKDTVKLGIPSLVMVVCTYVTVSVQSSATLAVTPAGAAASYYARPWYSLPYAILAVPITTTMFTEMSDSYAHEDMRAFKAGVTGGTSKIIFYLVPLSMLIFIFAEPLSGIFGLSEESIAMVVEYLHGLIFALPFYGVCMFFQKVCSSMHRMGLYAFANVVGSIFQTILCVFGSASLGLGGVAATSLVYFLGIDVTMIISFRKTLGPIGIKQMAISCARSLLIGVAGSAAGWAICAGLGMVVGAASSSAMHSLLYCFVGGIPSLVVTFGLAIALKMPESDFIKSLIAKVLHKA